MISTVAVGTDGTDTAAEAVKAAAEIAQRFDARLVLLSAVNEKHGPDAPPSGDAAEIQWTFNPAAQVREVLQRTEQRLQDQKVDCSTMVDEGDPGEVLVRLAEECDADLLVIGNKGMHRRVLGSVPNSVTHKAPCSVYVVKTT